MCDDLAERIGPSRMVVEGAGHEIQFTGRPLKGTACPVAHRLVALGKSAVFRGMNTA